MSNYQDILTNICKYLCETAWHLQYHFAGIKENLLPNIKRPLVYDHEGTWLFHWIYSSCHRLNWHLTIFTTNLQGGCEYLYLPCTATLCGRNTHRLCRLPINLLLHPLYYLPTSTGQPKPCNLPVHLSFLQEGHWKVSAELGTNLPHIFFFLQMW